MPKFSVIVPVFNVEKYVARCIESILEQTFSDFELILIDDGSTDKSGQICDEYALTDKRICVVHQENGGVSKARNTGLIHAQGEFVVFIDSDDSVEKYHLEGMASVSGKIDLVICGIKKVYADGIIFEKLYYENKTILEITREHILEMIDSKAFNYIYDKRFRRELIMSERIVFDVNLNLGEDTVFVANYLCKCKVIQYIEKISYRYYSNCQKTLSTFNESYVRRLIAINNKIEHILSAHVGNIADTVIWGKRNFSVFNYSIFYVLKNKNYRFEKKYRILKSIFNMREFKKNLDKLDIYMAQDSKCIRRVVSLRSPLLMIIFWEMVQIKYMVRL